MQIGLWLQNSNNLSNYSVKTVFSKQTNAENSKKQKGEKKIMADVSAFAPHIFNYPLPNKCQSHKGEAIKILDIF